MASSKEYLRFVLDQLSGAGDISHRPMMGEYILYINGKPFGGIYDNRFLVKAIPAAAALLPDAPEEIPYPGAKPMLMPDADDRALLAALVTAMEPELPEKRTRRTGNKPQGSA